MMWNMKTNIKLSGVASRIGKLRLVIALCLAGLVFTSCASAPEYPVYPAPTTKVLSAGYEDTFKAALVVLRGDERLELHTIDKAGRFLAWEKATGFIFFRHRTILDIELEPSGADETKMTLKLKAENYEMGGFTREAGWYPSPRVDTLLGADVVGLIEKELAKTES
jgi:hypothetical protein